MMHRAAALALVLAAPALGSAQGLPTPSARELSGSRPLAMGDAFRAIATTNEALYFNTAGIAVGEKYELDGGYAVNPGTELSRLSVSVVDSKTSAVAAGASYTRLRGEGAPGSVKGSVAQLAFGFPLGPSAALGIGGKYLTFDRPDETNAITADLGLLVRVAGLLSVGAAAYNVIDVRSDEAPFGAGFGLALGEDAAWRVAGDVALDLSRDDRTPATLHAGGEYFVAGLVPLRAGFRRDTERDRNFLSGGLGVVVQGFGADVAYAQNLDADESEDRTFSFTLKLFL